LRRHAKKAAKTHEKPGQLPVPQNLSLPACVPLGNGGSSSKVKGCKVPALDLKSIYEKDRGRNKSVFEQLSSRRDWAQLGGSKSARRYDPEADEDEGGVDPAALQKAWATSRQDLSSHGNAQYRKLRLDCNLQS